MDKFLFNLSPSSRTIMHTDGGSDVVIEKQFDAQPAIDRARYKRNEVKQTGELRHVMSVPTPLIYKWMSEGKLGADCMDSGSLIIDAPTLRKLMADPDISAFRAVDKL